MRKRWKVLLGLGATLVVAAAAPVLTIALACAPGEPAAEAFRPVIREPGWKRAEARTFLTYPEWFIVYSAETYGRFLARNPPSAFPYLRQVRGFWSGYCAVNRQAGQGAGEATVMLSTIGLSFSAEMILKALYEQTVGRLFEGLGGWHSPDDAYYGAVTRRYGAFMHETPWYRFPFGQAVRSLWSLPSGGHALRHVERQVALTGELGVKTGYARAIGWASGAALGRDELRLRMVVEGGEAAIRAADSRLVPVRDLGANRWLVEAPRYAQFTDILGKLASAPVTIREIAGNDRIFVTLLAKDGAALPGERVLAMPLDDRPGWSRVGVAVPVERLLALLRDSKARGAELEHVYDY